MVRIGSALLFNIGVSNEIDLYLISIQ